MQPKDVFQFEVDGSKPSDNSNHLRLRRAFWDQFYVERGNEQKIEEFLDSSTPMLFVTGHVGTGKSTFVRRHYEKTNRCGGIIINWRKHAGKFANSMSQKEASEMMFEVIASAYRVAILENITYSIYHDKNELKDVHYSLDIDIEEAQVSDRRWIELKDKAEARLAVEALLWLSFSECPSLNEPMSEFGDFDIDLPIEERRKHLLSIIRKPSQSARILSKLTWIDFIRLYRRVFFQPEKPHVITLDNLDRDGSAFLKSVLVDTALDLCNQLNQTGEFPTSTYGLSAVKIILAVRDENIGLFHLQEGAAHRIQQITMNANDYPIPNEVQRFVLPVDSCFLYKVISARMNLIKSEFDIKSDYLRDFFSVIYGFWLDEEAKDLKSKIGLFSVLHFCSESIRLVLDFIFESTESMIEWALRVGYDIRNSKLSNYLLDGFLYRFVIESKYLTHILEEVKHSFIDEKANSRLCSFRKVIGALNNAPKLIRTLDQLITSLSPLGFTPEEIRQTVFCLYQSEERQGEFVTIYQRNHIKTSLDIDPKAYIRLNLKGAFLLDRIFRSWEFQCWLALGDEKFHVKILAELDPTEAIDYLSKVFSHIDNSSKSHLLILEKIIKYKGDSKGYPGGFASYRENFLIKSVPFYTRVCDTIANLLNNYLTELCCGRFTDLPISEYGRIDLSKLIQDRDARHYKNSKSEFKKKTTIDNFERIMDSLKLKSNNIGLVFDYLKRFVSLKGHIQTTTSKLN
jgi:hypothetical protein